MEKRCTTELDTSRNNKRYKSNSIEISISKKNSIISRNDTGTLPSASKSLPNVPSELASTSHYLRPDWPKLSKRWSQETLKAPSDTELNKPRKSSLIIDVNIKTNDARKMSDLKSDLSIKSMTDSDKPASRSKKNFYAKTYKKLMSDSQTGQLVDETPKNWANISASELKYLPSTSKKYRPKLKESDTSIKPSKENSATCDEDKNGNSNNQYLLTSTDGASKKAQFRNEKSLLTFHEPFQLNFGNSSQELVDKAKNKFKTDPSTTKATKNLNKRPIQSKSNIECACYDKDNGSDSIKQKEYDIKPIIGNRKSHTRERKQKDSGEDEDKRELYNNVPNFITRYYESDIKGHAKYRDENSNLMNKFERNSRNFYNSCFNRQNRNEIDRYRQHYDETDRNKRNDETNRNQRDDETELSQQPFDQDNGHKQSYYETTPKFNDVNKESDIIQIDRNDKNLPNFDDKSHNKHYIADFNRNRHNTDIYHNNRQYKEEVDRKGRNYNVINSDRHNIDEVNRTRHDIDAINRLNMSDDARRLTYSEEMVMEQLSKIIRLLERKDAT
ncbi:jg14246 [Pararge aegeria aegeria]|uniref:Jg14246 protein n=1 Tax=Pararge aegeria aegeria TaxID=348720 RepID=A0A8S4RIW7_9NEOP|nr:jg14246 [Pararge aegeria aegeria]